MNKQNDRRRLLKTYRFVLQKCFEAGIYDEDVRRLAELLGVGERTYWSASEAFRKALRAHYERTDKAHETEGQ